MNENPVLVVLNDFFLREKDDNIKKIKKESKVKIVQLPNEHNKIKLIGSVNQIQHAKIIIHCIKQYNFTKQPTLVQSKHRLFLKHRIEIHNLQRDLQNINQQNSSARGVFATMITCTFKMNFNAQMGKIIDDLWMDLTTSDKEMFYSASKNIELQTDMKKKKVMNQIKTEQSHIDKIGLPAAELDMLEGFYTLENYETTPSFRCLEDSCPAPAYTKKDSLQKHSNRKHKITKFNCPEETNGKKCPFSSTSLLAIQKHRNRFHGRNITIKNNVSIYEQTRNAHYSTLNEIQAEETATAAVQDNVTSSTANLKENDDTKTTTTEGKDFCMEETGNHGAQIIDKEAEEKLALLEEFFCVEDSNEEIIEIPTLNNIQEQTNASLATSSEITTLIFDTSSSVAIATGKLDIILQQQDASLAKTSGITTPRIDTTSSVATAILQQQDASLVTSSGITTTRIDTTSSVATAILQQQDASLATSSEIIPPKIDTTSSVATAILQQQDEALATSSEITTPSNDTSSSVAIARQNIIQIHIQIEKEDKIDIGINQDLNKLIPHIERHLNQKISAQDILEINQQKMNRNLGKRLERAMRHCSDLALQPSLVSITLKLSTSAIPQTANHPQNSTLLESTAIETFASNHTLQPVNQNYVNVAAELPKIKQQIEPRRSSLTSHATSRSQTGQLQPVSAEPGPSRNQAPVQQENVQTSLCILNLIAAVTSEDILNKFSQFGQIKSFKRNDPQNAKIQFATADANTFMRQNTPCFIAGRRCKVILSKMPNILMTKTEKDYLMVYNNKQL